MGSVQPHQWNGKLINKNFTLFPHDSASNFQISTDYNPELDRSECLALRDFKAGEQLFIFYGPRSNADLFIHNGYVITAPYNMSVLDYYYSDIV